MGDFIPSHHMLCDKTDDSLCIFGGKATLIRVGEVEFCSC